MAILRLLASWSAVLASSERCLVLLNDVLCRLCLPVHRRVRYFFLRFWFDFFLFLFSFVMFAGGDEFRYLCYQLSIWFRSRSGMRNSCSGLKKKQLHYQINANCCSNCHFKVIWFFSEISYKQCKNTHTHKSIYAYSFSLFSFLFSSLLSHTHTHTVTLFLSFSRSFSFFPLSLSISIPIFITLSLSCISFPFKSVAKIITNIHTSFSLYLEEKKTKIPCPFRYIQKKKKYRIQN